MLQKPAGTTAARKPQSDSRRIGPYSRTLRRGVIGTSAIDGRSTAGRYWRDLEAQLVAHCGGAPTITQKLLIERLIRTTVQLNALDEKLLAADNWTDHDARTHGGLINRQRLLLRELGLRGKDATGPSLAEYLRRKGEAGAAA
jgi:hypothetical protein